jgi:glycosyltransferase involved in cell wall biosynthesis
VTDVIEMRRALGAATLADYDVVLTHHPLAAIAALSIKERPPIVHVYHSSPAREAAQRRGRGLSITGTAASMMLEWLLRKYEEIALARVEGIVTLSEFSSRLAISVHSAARGRITVAGGGVDTQQFEPASDRAALRDRLGIKPDQTVLLTVRRLVPRMGLESLLDSVALMAARDPTVQLAVIGDGELRDSLRARRYSLGIADRVEFLGRLSDQEVLEWYQAADVFILPTIAYEGFGMVTAEALACGTPVVGTDVGATAELLREAPGSKLIPPEDPQRLAEAVSQLMDSTMLDDDVRSRCRAYAVDRFAWAVAITRWEAAILSVAARPRTSE